MFFSKTSRRRLNLQRWKIYQMHELLHLDMSFHYLWTNTLSTAIEHTGIVCIKFVKYVSHYIRELVSLFLKNIWYIKKKKNEDRIEKFEECQCTDPSLVTPHMLSPTVWITELLSKAGASLSIPASPRRFTLRSKTRKRRLPDTRCERESHPEEVIPQFSRLNSTRFESGTYLYWNNTIAKSQQNEGKLVWKNDIHV